MPIYLNKSLLSPPVALVSPSKTHHNSETGLWVNSQATIWQEWLLPSTSLPLLERPSSKEQMSGSTSHETRNKPFPPDSLLSLHCHTWDDGFGYHPDCFVKKVRLMGATWAWFQSGHENQAVWLQVSNHPNRVSHSSSNNKQGITSTISLVFIISGIILPGVFFTSSSSVTQHWRVGNTPWKLYLLHTFFPVSDYNTCKGLCEPSIKMSSLFYCFEVYRMYSWPSIFMGSKSTDSTSHRLETCRR